MTEQGLLTRQHEPNSERAALFPTEREPDTDTSEINIERGYDKTLDGKNLDAAIDNISARFGQDAGIIAATNTDADTKNAKIEILAEGFEKLANELSVGIVETSEDEKSFHNKALEALKSVGEQHINEELAKELQEAHLQVRQLTLERADLRSENYALERSLKDRKLLLMVKVRDLSDAELRGPLGGNLYAEIKFIDTLLNRRETPLEPPTRILPTTEELEAQMDSDRLTSPDVSPPLGIDLRKISSRVMGFVRPTDEK